MGINDLSEELCQQAVDAFNKFNNKAEAARHLSIPVTTLKSRLDVAARRGMCGFSPVLPGFEITGTSTQFGKDGEIEREWIRTNPEGNEEEFKVPLGHVVKGVSALVGPNDQVLAKWIKTREDGSGLDIVAALQDAFKDYKSKTSPLKKPKHHSKNLLTLIPMNDLHLNMLCWAREVGINWDLKIAEKKIGQAFEDVVERSSSSETCIILGGGDLLHADTNENRTAKSGNILDADGRHQKALEVAQRLKVKIIDLALQKHNRVIVRILKGNHDEYSSVAITYFLKAYYRNEPRITVDTDASLFFYHRFGSVMLAATHGHTVKINQMPSIIAHRRAEDWGNTKFRYCHVFHIHHHSKVASEGNGVICESHQAPIPQDAWHHGSGYLSGRSVQTIQYHSSYGEIGRVRVAILDEIES